MIQNRKHYAWATHSSLPADRFHTETDGHFAFTRYRCEISYWSEILAPVQERGSGGVGGGVNSCRGDSRWHDILWWYHVNKYRAMRGNRSELAPRRKSLCTLYVNCFILSFASNRQGMVPACFVVGVVKHWMQTDVRVCVS